MLPLYDFQSGNKLNLPSSKKDFYEFWLEDKGYKFEGYVQLLPTKTDTASEASLYCKRDGSAWAVYIPELGVGTECLHFNIPSIEKAKDLIDTAQQLLTGIIATLDVAKSIQGLWSR